MENYKQWNKIHENEKLAGNALHISIIELRIIFRWLFLLHKYNQSSVELLQMKYIFHGKDKFSLCQLLKLIYF